MKGAIVHNRNKINIIVQAIDPETNKVVGQWYTCGQAARAIDTTASAIAMCCRGERRLHRGLIWQYLEVPKIEYR